MGQRIIKKGYGMRTRYKKYSDYGMTSEDVFATNEFINSLSDKECIVLSERIKESLPKHIGIYVAKAVIYKCGYTQLCKSGMLYDKSDFYGYKRLAYSIANEYRKELINERNGKT